MFRQLGPAEIIVILVVLVLLFGARRLPDAARSLGRSLRIFKSEVKQLHDDDGKPDTVTEPAAPREVEGRVTEPRSAEPRVAEPRVAEPAPDERR